MPGPESGDRYGRSLRILRLGNFASVYDRYSMPAMLLAIARDFDVSVSQVSIAVSAYFMAYALMQPLWGIASSQLGLARVMRFCAGRRDRDPARGPVAVGGRAGRLPRCRRRAARRARAHVADLCRQRVSGCGASARGDRVDDRECRRHHDRDGSVRRVRGTDELEVGAGNQPSVRPRSGRVDVPAAGSVGGRTGSSVSRRLAFKTLRSRYVLLLLALVFVEGAAVQGCLTFLPTALESAGLSTVVSSTAIMFFGAAVVATATVVGRLSARTPASVFIAAGAVAGACGAAGIGLLGSLLAGVTAAASSA
jgi:hypothetical protein